MTSDATTTFLTTASLYINFSDRLFVPTPACTWNPLMLTLIPKQSTNTPNTSNDFLIGMLVGRSGVI